MSKQILNLRISKKNFISQVQHNNLRSTLKHVKEVQKKGCLKFIS